MPIDLTPIVKPLNDVVEPVTNSLSDAWSAVIGDRIAAWRLKNAAKLQAKVNDELDRMGVTLNSAKIPERYAFAWFDEATKQDEPEIQELFARLLAKAAAGDKDAADRRNLEILTRMTPMDAVTFQWIYDNCQSPKSNFPSMDEFELWRTLVQKYQSEGSLSLEHLISLGVLERQFSLKIDTHVSRIAPSASASTFKDVLHSLPNHLTLTSEVTGNDRGQSLYAALAIKNGR